MLRVGDTATMPKFDFHRCGVGISDYGRAYKVKAMTVGWRDSLWAIWYTVQYNHRRP